MLDTRERDVKYAWTRC